MKKNAYLIIALMLCAICITGCTSCKAKSTADRQDASQVNTTQETAAQENSPEVNTTQEPIAQLPVTNGKIIVIDPGHQTKDSSGKEPIGPGSSEMKQKDTSGATGVSTGLREYELNLQVSNKLKDELENRGYTVIMTRTQNVGEISCIERAEVANNANADAYIRIHANSVDDSGVSGIMTICPTSHNPYNGNIYSECKRLSVDVLDELVASTGARRERVWETDTMTGNNWSKVPVTLVEMGYMSNPREDELMATEEYQRKIAQGIANGIDKYFL